jgi:hypothetical protein
VAKRRKKGKSKPKLLVKSVFFYSNLEKVLWQKLAKPIERNFCHL